MKVNNSLDFEIQVSKICLKFSVSELLIPRPKQKVFFIIFISCIYPYLYLRLQQGALAHQMASSNMNTKVQMLKPL